MSEQVSAQMLEGLMPLRELESSVLSRLAEEAEIEPVGAKSVIFRQGDQDGWTRYVLSGEVVVVDGAGARRSIIGMGDAGVADEPLGLNQPHGFNALARTEVKLIRLPTTRIHQAIEAHRLPTYQVEQVSAEEGEASDRLFYKLVEDLMAERLALPSLPDVAVRVRQAVKDKDASASEVAKIAQADPAVATCLVQAANSALYGNRKSVDSLSAAIVRLGLRNVRELVTAVTMKQVFKSTSRLLRQRMTVLWVHSTLVAAICAALARRVGGFDPDRALLAGLVHDIGAVPMIAHAANYGELVRDPALLERTIAEHRAGIGAMILRRWNFSEEMVTVALKAEEWQRDHDGPADYADLVIAAQLQGYMGTEAASQYPDLDGLAVYARLGLADLGVCESKPILEEAREEIAEVQRLLTG